MRVVIIGAGPVGLMCAILFTGMGNQVRIYEKRQTYMRSHSLSISRSVIESIRTFLQHQNILPELDSVLLHWQNNSVSTNDIEYELSALAMNLGVQIHNNTVITDYSTLKCDILIGADGAKSSVRTYFFGDELVDTHCVGYIAQLKFQTPGGTRPRGSLSTFTHTVANGLLGSDMVLNFESLDVNTQSIRKSGTLHIPITEKLYAALSAHGRGTYSTAWTYQELNVLPEARALISIIDRYHTNLKWRGGWIEDAKLSVLPLHIYRSAHVYRKYRNMHVMLVGDASSGMVYERGLNKGWLEALECTRVSPDYEDYCRSVYETERDATFQKHTKIVKVGDIASGMSKIVVGGAVIIAATLIAKHL